MTDPAEIAAKLSTKAALVICQQWPRNCWALHRAHIRHFHRTRLIEQHSATEYRLTQLGLKVRAILKEQQP